MIGKIKLCWQCGKKLQPGFGVIHFNGARLSVHKTCRKDAENLLFHDKVTFQGEEISERRGDEQG